MQAAKRFPQFPDLPPEIQLQIWEATGATLPSMHMFDVCVPAFPAPTGQNPVSSPYQNEHGRSECDTMYIEEADDTLSLDTLNTHDDSTPPTATTTQGARFRTDPSMYTFQDSLRASCTDSYSTLQRMTARKTAEQDTNTIYLPAGRALTYNNAQDVLHLRFAPPASRFPGDGRHTSPISAMFESIWSEGLASALHRARRVAIDVSQLWPDLADGGQSDVMQDIAYLACVLQNDLEVLYLVDYCAGRCSNRGVDKVGRLVRGRGGELYRKMYGYGCVGGVGAAERKGAWARESRREPDVFHGVGKIWREVFELEMLGWEERHPGFVFAEAFSEVVRMQQSNYVDDRDEGPVNMDVKFQGVRVLIAEDEEVDGVDCSMALSCGCGPCGPQTGRQS